MQTIYLDISNKGVVPTIYAKQGDVGRKFEVVFTNSGLSYVPPNGSVFSAWYSGSSGEGNYTDIGENSAFSINGNKVTVELITQMLTNEGSGILCLVLNESNGNQIGSWNIPYLCEKVPGFESEGAKEYYTAFSESVKKLKQFTENLTPEAIGAAPAGYGLGSKAVTVNSWNDAIANGFYQSAKDGPVATNKWYYGFVHSYDDKCKYVVQKVWANEATQYSNEFYSAERRRYSGTWGEWEWVNPPMEPGVEYRTTERIDGKAVYKKKSGGFIYYRLEGDEAAMTPTVWMDGIFNRINGVNMRSLYFGENTNTRMQLHGRGAYLVGVTFNGGSGALYIIYADSSNQPLTRVHKIDGSSDLELGFVLDTSNGELEITCPHQWSYGFIIGSGASIGWV